MVLDGTMVCVRVDGGGGGDDDDCGSTGCAEVVSEREREREREPDKATTAKTKPAARSPFLPSAAGGASANGGSRHQHRPLSLFTVVRLRCGAEDCILYRCPACLKEPHTFIYLCLFTQTLRLRQIQ
jgi:hypothetical protein